jgi:type IV fimbrial biogenesis protein FimT
MKNHGFTLYELLITLVVIAITLAIGVPSFNKTIQNTRTKTATLELLSAIEQARSTAVFSNSRSVLTSKNQWHSGWDLFIDSDDDGLFDTDEQLLTAHGPLDAVIIKGNSHIKELISFIGSGEGRTPGKANTGVVMVGTLTICPTVHGAGYKISLSKGGRSRVSKLTEAACDQTK